MNLGRAVWVSPKVVIAGSVDRFVIRFVVGSEGIDPGGGLRIYPPITYGNPWNMVRWWPEDVRAKGPPGTCLLGRVISPHLGRYDEARIDLMGVENVGRRLEPGEEIDISFIARVQTFPMEDAGFHIEVDSCGEGVYSSLIVDMGSAAREAERTYGLAERPSVKVVPAAPSKIVVTACPSVNRDGHFSVGVKVEDTYGNLATDYRGMVKLSVDGEMGGLPREVTFRPEDGGVVIIENCEVKTSGALRITARDGEDPLLDGESHPFAASVPYNVYFGDIHAHSSLSDGFGSPSDYYRYARDVAHISVCALSDHGPLQEEAIEATESFYEPGRFVTLHGWEWGCRIAKHHKNIYYPNISSVRELMDGTPNTTPELFEYYRGRDVLIVPHHPNFSTASYWKTTDWRWHDETTQRLVEIAQIRGNSETEAREGEWGSCDHGASVRRALSMGYHLGFLGGSDNHRGQPGGPAHPLHPAWTGDPHYFCLGAFLARELTRETIWEAMRARRIYATTGDRILLRFEVNGHPMGSEIITDVPPHIIARVHGTDEIVRFVLIKNGTTAHIIDHPGRDATIDWIDRDFRPESGESYYYVRVQQKNGQMAWASPIWVRAEPFDGGKDDGDAYRRNVRFLNNFS